MSCGTSLDEDAGGVPAAADDGVRAVTTMYAPNPTAAATHAPMIMPAPTRRDARVGVGSNAVAGGDATAYGGT